MVLWALKSCLTTAVEIRLQLEYLKEIVVVPDLDLTKYSYRCVCLKRCWWQTKMNFNDL